MWDRSSTRRPIASFNLPPHPPEPVAEAYATFDRVASEWADLLGQIDDAGEQAKQAKADARDAVTAAAFAGKANKTSIVAVEAEHRARVEELQEQADAVAVAVDQAGNELAQAIAANRAPWLDALAAAEQTAAERYAAAVLEAKAAVRDLAPARGAVGWLRDFDTGQAIVGRQQAFVGGRVDLDTTRVPRETRTPADRVLALLDQVTAPAEPAKARRHNVTTR
jgi:hypothetical protein